MDVLCQETDRQTDRHGMDLLCQKRERERQTDRQTDRDKVGGKGVGTGGSRRLLNIRLLDVKWMIPKAELECDF